MKNKTDEVRNLDDGRVPMEKSREESLRKFDIYEGKFFYEILRHEKGRIELSGPLPNIRYVTKSTQSSEYDYVQVIEGSPVQVFTTNEILVLNRRL